MATHSRLINRTFVLSLFVVLIILSAFALGGCSRSGRHVYRIGVSQCLDDAWRQKMDQELRNEQIFHPEIELIFRHADGVSAEQCAHIDSFIAERVDLLIVSPNEAVEVQPAVERAYDAGIPVIVADRRVRGNKWTAFIGGDNLQVGYLMADWLIGQAKRKGSHLRVLEITGLPGSTPAVQRHEGMMRGIYGKPVDLVASACGKWFTDPAFEACDSLLDIYRDIDAIVAQNDLMARGVALACQRHNQDIAIMGVDGMTGHGGGVEAVHSGLIDVTATYPSRGDLVMQTAVAILNHQPYNREMQLQSVLIGPHEAQPIALLAEEHDNQIAAIKTLQDNISMLNSHISMQKMLTMILGIVLLLILVLAIVTWRVLVYRSRVRRERKAHLEEVRRQQQQLEALTAELAEVKQSRLSKSEEDETFLRTLQERIEKTMDDPELSVDNLARDMGMSRTVLFRKVKSATGQSPVELIRHIRMRRAKELLEKSNYSVSQVAYMVGFSAPSYFAKCYREEFGVTPSEHK